MVEILSPSTQRRDRGVKLKLYDSQGVGEYWIIDTIQRRVEFLRLGEDGRYGLARLEENRTFRSRLIPGFWLNVEWLIGDETPEAYECLQQLLAGD